MTPATWIDYLDSEVREAFHLQDITGLTILHFTEEEWNASIAEIRKSREDLEECCKESK